MATPHLVDPFFRKLYSVLSEDINARTISLATGSASRTIDDRSTVAEKYAAEVAYIDALNTVLEKCKEIEIDMYGNRPKAEVEE